MDLDLFFLLGAETERSERSASFQLEFLIYFCFCFRSLPFASLTIMLTLSFNAREGKKTCEKFPKTPKLKAFFGANLGDFPLFCHSSA